MRGFSGHIKLFVCILMLSVSFSACGSQSKASMSVYDTVTKTNISLGMDKASVDKALGVPGEANALKVYDYQGLEVFYRNGRVAGLILADTDRFETLKGIRPGSTREDVLKAYGDSNNTAGDTNLNYLYGLKDGTLAKLSPTELETEPEASMVCLAISLDDNGAVGMILIGDYAYVMNAD